MDYEKKYNEALERASHIKDNNTVATPQEVAEHIFPELRESEDERIRKELLNFVRSFWADHKEKLPQASRWVTYLEKQKEQNHDGKKWIYEDDYHKDMERCFNDGKDEVLENPEKYGLRKEQKPNYCHHEVDETGWTEEYRKAYYDGWNNCNMQHEQLKADHKPAEWSEEDEDAIQQAILALEDRYDEHEPNLHFLGYKLPFNKAAERLKSLRPQPQGVYKIAIESILKMCESYEKKGIFTEERAIDFLGNVRVKCKDAIECAPILDEPSWKPSEEQMDSLRDTIVRTKGYSYSMYLPELYEQLKKL